MLTWIGPIFDYIIKAFDGSIVFANDMVNNTFVFMALSVAEDN
jgi:hypothetical protein